MTIPRLVLATIALTLCAYTPATAQQPNVVRLPDAEGCVGNELVVGSRATSITVSGGGQGDDPKAGPSELQTIRPVRLELPSRPNPASAFRPSR